MDNRPVKILVIVFAVIAIGLFGFHWIYQWHHSRLQHAVQDEKKECLQKIAQLEEEIDQLAQEVGSHRSAANVDLRNVFGVIKPDALGKIDEVDCQKITSQAIAFFRYLDSKGYLMRPGVELQAEEMFAEIGSKLAAHPPVNVGEMEDIYSLIRNMTHFYRLLGKDRLNALRDVFASESVVLEPAMSVMFAWVTTCKSGNPTGKGQIQLDTLYQYACYFLNTLAGRSYLLRREGKVRLLVNYYALLIVDMANSAKRNSLGLDIRPHMDYVFYDLNNQKGLLYRDRYLTRLAVLRNKYAQ
jgi:hypothetical protein